VGYGARGGQRVASSVFPTPNVFWDLNQPQNRERRENGSTPVSSHRITLFTARDTLRDPYNASSNHAEGFNTPVQERSTSDIPEVRSNLCIFGKLFSSLASICFTSHRPMTSRASFLTWTIRSSLALVSAIHRQTMNRTVL